MNGLQNPGRIWNPEENGGRKQDGDFMVVQKVATVREALKIEDSIFGP